MAEKQVVLAAFLLYYVPKGCRGRMLPFHYPRYCPHVSFTAVLSMSVLQHCLSRQRARVANASPKVFDAFRVSTGTTDEGQTSAIFTDAIHNKRVQ
jgi:hypothetical protein